VADSKVYCKRILGLCLEQGVELITLVPRNCAVRQELEVRRQQRDSSPLLLEKPEWTHQEAPRCWHAHGVVRQVEVEYADGRLAAPHLLIHARSPLLRRSRCNGGSGTGFSHSHIQLCSEGLSPGRGVTSSCSMIAVQGVPCPDVRSML
jgi:hypothetical protein